MSGSLEVINLDKIRTRFLCVGFHFLSVLIGVSSTKVLARIKDAALSEIWLSHQFLPLLFKAVGH